MEPKTVKLEMVLVEKDRMVKIKEVAKQLQVLWAKWITDEDTSVPNPEFFKSLGSLLDMILNEQIEIKSSMVVQNEKV